MKDFIAKIDKGLSEQDMMAAMRLIMEGQASDEDLKTFLTRLHARGETVAEITGATRIMREKAASIKAPHGSVDCCGTGGDQSGSYNVSTAVALVAASCGVPMAKHGNRAASSKSGTADVLEALGVNLDVPKERLEQALRELNFCFLMAPHHHQAMKHVREVRKQLGTRTIFNLLGPLSNPAGAEYQLLGVYDKTWLKPIAETLRNLGTKGAWIVHGSDGLDEITTTGPTDVVILKNGEITQKEIQPSDFGLNSASPADLQGGDAQVNADALMEILRGRKNAYRDIVLANAAAVLVIHSDVYDMTQGVYIAAQALDSGKALALLEAYKRFSHE